MTESFNFQGIKFLPAGIEDALRAVVSCVPRKRGDYFCFANIHLVMESHKEPELRSILNNSAGNFPDGMGVALALKFLGSRFEDRVRGADFMLRLCAYAAGNNLRVFFYGNTPETLEALEHKLRNMFPKIQVAGAVSPPFRPLTREEDEAYVKQINDSGADILFVSLGAPKQEKWMAGHKGRIQPVQLGVGAAFSFLTGKVREAPKWMQKTALEWLFRLPQQPKKTFVRMLLVPEFLFRTFLQLFKR